MKGRRPASRFRRGSDVVSSTAETTRGARASRSAGGFSLIETLAAATIILTGLLTLTTSIVRSKSSRVEAEQQMEATSTLQQAAATLQALGVTSGYQAYAPNVSGAPYPATGSGPGAAFLASRLAAAASPSKRASVVVQFFTNETVKRSDLGLPRDLDGDGVATDVNTAKLGADGQLVATVLPYLLSITYRGPGGGATTATCQGVVTRVR